MFDHVILYKDNVDYVYIKDESEIRNDSIYIVIDNEIDVFVRNDKFKYIFSYEYVEHLHKKMFVISMYCKFKDKLTISKKYFSNFNIAKDYFSNLSTF